MCRLLSRIRLSFSSGVSRSESADSVHFSQRIVAFVIEFLSEKQRLQWEVFPLHQQLEIHLDPDRWRWTSAKIKRRNNSTMKISLSLLVLSMTSLSLSPSLIWQFFHWETVLQRTNERTRSRTMISSSFSVGMSSQILRSTVFTRRMRACIDPHSLGIVNQSVSCGNQRFFRRFLAHKTKRHWFERWKRIEHDGRWTRDKRRDPKSTWNPNHTIDRSSPRQSSFSTLQSLVEGRMKKKMKRDLLRWVGVPKEWFHLGRRFLSINRIEGRREKELLSFTGHTVCPTAHNRSRLSADSTLKKVRWIDLRRDDGCEWMRCSDQRPCPSDHLDTTKCCSQNEILLPTTR